jgi:hypothetical protein
MGARTHQSRCLSGGTSFWPARGSATWRDPSRRRAASCATAPSASGGGAAARRSQLVVAAVGEAHWTLCHQHMTWTCRQTCWAVAARMAPATSPSAPQQLAPCGQTSTCRMCGGPAPPAGPAAAAAAPPGCHCGEQAVTGRHLRHAGGAHGGLSGTSPPSSQDWGTRCSRPLHTDQQFVAGAWHACQGAAEVAAAALQQRNTQREALSCQQR